MCKIKEKYSRLTKIKSSILIGVLSVTMTLSMGSCADAKQITPEKAVDIYMANKGVWKYHKTEVTNNYYYTFLDLDFDGTLELIASGNSGSANYTDNTYYRIHPDTKTVEEIKKSNTNSKNDEYNLVGISKLFRNNKSGEMFYYCTKSLWVSGYTYTTNGVLNLEDNKITEINLFGSTISDNSTSNTEKNGNEYYYYENNIAVKTDEKTYKEKIDAFENENTNLYLAQEYIYGSEFDSEDEETQRELLLEKYNKFSYDGYKETNYQDDGSGPEVIGSLTEDFTFSSGGGAWGTAVSINSDCSFNVDFHDGELSIKGEDYPNGTMYKADATGKFTDIKRINDYTYSMKMSELTYEKALGTEEIKDDIKYVYRTAYGLENAKRVYLYTPDAPISELPESLLMWVRMGGEQYKDATLGFYALYNVDEHYGFTSNNK